MIGNQTMSDTKKKKNQEDIDISEQASEAISQENTEVVELKNQLADITDRWKRALADYQNLEKRTEERRNDFVQYAIKGFLEKLLDVVDDLEMAGKHLKDTGLDLALKKLYGVLQSEGLERIDTKGKEYDIQTMEAIQIVDEKEDGKVIIEHRAGYLLHGSVLRPAQVTVSKKTLNSKS